MAGVGDDNVIIVEDALELDVTWTVAVLTVVEGDMTTRTKKTRSTEATRARRTT
jgi:hypothetical protein